MREPRDRALVGLASVLVVASLALLAATVLFGYRNTKVLGGEIDWVGVVWLLWPLALVVVGAVVASARPRVFVGWGLLLAGSSIHVIGFGGTYGGWARLVRPSAPLAGLATWAGLAASGLFSMMAPLVVMRLPSGHLDGRFAHILSRVSLVMGTALVAWWGFGGEQLPVNTLSGESLSQPPLPSPIRLAHLSRTAVSGVTTALTLSLLVCFLTSIGLVLLRRRHASPVERAQLRWLAGGLLILPMVALLQILVGDLADVALVDLLDTLLLVIGIGAIPVSIAISVLKFRLFEIDRLISRTVVFAVVALVLGALYAVLAILPFTLMAGLGGGDTPSWVVAGSTLLAAALFSPLRRRVRAAVDRRFNRSRYDAERVIERFSEQVRQSTDLDAITSGVAGAVRGALQPTRMAMWLREGT